MADVERLREAYEKADGAYLDLANEYDEKRAALKEKYLERLGKAADKAREAQGKLADAEAAAALVGRDDAEVVASNLGLTLPKE